MGRSYGEAMGGKHKARAGLVRAYMAHKGWHGTSKQWSEGIARDYRRLLLIGSKEVTTARLTKEDLAKGKARARDGKKVLRKGMDQTTAAAELAALGASEAQVDVRLSQAIQHRVRYFIDGAVIGSREYVNEVFEKCRERFGERRTSGARKMRGSATPAAGMIWSVRDLRVDVTDEVT